MRTQSERWFEAFCDANAIALARIGESSSRTPDYELRLGEETVIVEVKEILPNDEEKASIEKLERTGVGLVTGGIPGARVRGKIADASAQLKSRAERRLASLLVLSDIKFGCGQITGHLDRYHLRVAMEGLDQVILSVPKDFSIPPRVASMKSGPKKKMTAAANTSISAIGVLSTPPGAPIHLAVYHNRYAAIPISTDKLKELRVPQYILSGSPNGPSEWVEL